MVNLRRAQTSLVLGVVLSGTALVADNTVTTVSAAKAERTANSHSADDTADWPMWRYNAARSGVTPHKLPSDLQLRWKRQLPVPIPAWPASQFKLQFDVGYEPVCADGKLLVASNVDGTVQCFDAENGQLLWRFFTDAPVRFAPAVVDDRVLVVSDDGCLHCMDLSTGVLRWSDSGAPSNQRIIGNNRLTSMWPARGGVVVDGGVAWFAAGIWPSMGIFVKAIDVESGRVLWNNSTTGSTFVTHPHGAKSFGSITPQGYLAVHGNDVFVPGGRTLPGLFNRSTGQMRHFDFGNKGEGGFQVSVSDSYYFVGGRMFRSSDGTSLGSISADLVGPDEILSANGSHLTVTSLQGSVTVKTGKDRRGREVTTTSFHPDRSHKYTLDGPGRLFLQAGHQIFAADGGRIAAYEPLSGKTELSPSWSGEVDGDVTSLIAASDQLYATTKQGGLYCFGAMPPYRDEQGEVRSVESVQRTFAEIAASEGDSSHDPIAAQLAAFAPESDGYAVSIGMPRFRTLEQVLQKTGLHVIAADRDASAIQRFREWAVQDHRFGLRVSAATVDFAKNELPECFASFVFCEDARNWSGSELAAAFEILRPYGGLCCLRTTDKQHTSIDRSVVDSGLHGAHVTRSGSWTLLRRNGPLKGAGRWTHQYGDASSTSVSQDSRVKAPLGLLWFGGPSNDKVLPRHGHGPSPQVAGGRLFIEGADMLRCVDVYTGRVWWEREFPGLGTFYDNTSHQSGAGEIGGNYVSLEDHVYVIHNANLLELDATTGETMRRFTLPGPASPTAWGALFVDADVLIAAASPVLVPDPDEKDDAADHSMPVVPQHAVWKYLAGSDPPEDWIQPSFNDGEWNTGAAGFGYGDNDDRTVLKDMQGRYTRVYLRHAFETADVDLSKLQLKINYDDAFIAYMNGHEVARSGVKSGHGATAQGVASHEADGFVDFDLSESVKWLKPGRNVVAVEGHNSGPGSSDFSLDPWLAIPARAPTETTKKLQLADVLTPADYSSASRTVVAFDRHTGELLWSRDAQLNFRHNAICAADGRVYCIDAMSPTKLAALKRRGVEPEAVSRLLALDALSGNEIWSTSEDVFGTFLSYSREYDVLLQSGSAYRDRAKDEVGTGLIAYQGSNGSVIWKDLDRTYGGPCLIHGDRIITNGAGGFEMELLTGRPTGWKYSRMYGCNTAVGSQHLLTFRSGAAGFCDLSGDSGTGNFGGFRSSCTSNLIVADGVLNAPDYTRTCTCAYQLQTSLALVHRPLVESWTFGNEHFNEGVVKSIGLNLGAPGDRRDADEVLWFDYPIVGGPSPRLSVETEPANPETFAVHSSLMAPHPLNWVGGSGLKGVRHLRCTIDDSDILRSATVRLVFSEPEGLPPSERVFSVSVNDTVVLSDLDIASRSAEERATVIHDVPIDDFDGTLRIQLVPAPESAPPVISGMSLRIR